MQSSPSSSKTCLWVAFVVVVAALFSASTEAWSQPTRASTSTSTSTSTGTSRADFMKQLSVGVGVSAAAFVATTNTVTIQPANAAEVDTDTLPSGVKREIVKSGTGEQPKVGELIAIRFVAYAGSNKIDDIMETPEPYYTRLGSGGLLPGVESTLPLMKVGDRWKLTIPGNLAFGPKGRPASAGKPRIPANAEIDFEVEIVGLPGREPELIDLIGDD